ncbi:M20/M25/M40 family metallo-hydrolase [Pseudanabaena sp. FACHB-2040]|uniref:M20/M25/M40 family metallo-hydrolase n=1 Tax=Pseudanabaena sp. FACHB-2040 TaxID=2692859 RepID=UPI001688FEEC|nr:M20/M25/M40 family metallo-hydrolase [Pseudanabaena sp. FACHB-2040]MBD2260362.1 M20/M25/M40 family metallo-hydrolase [Pseudanabaena sp. FACHB-2040]
MPFFPRQGLLWGVCAIAAPIMGAIPAQAATLGIGATAAQETYYLSEFLAGRSIGTAKEAETVDYLSERLSSFGYTPELQPFTYTFRGQQFTSYNVIAERQGTSSKQIILGAHYDTAPSSATLDRSGLEGTNDNASGVGVLLELAERLQQDTNLTVKFVFFGAEEIGLIGSEYYANSLSPEEIRNTAVMVNLDSLVLGDKLYLHAGRGAAENPDWFRFRDLTLEIAEEYGIAAETNPGLNPNYPAGTGCCSDLESFDLLMPVVAAEATNWDIGDLDGYTQTSNPAIPNGATWHIPALDNREVITTVFPGLIEQRTRDYTLIFDTFIDRVDADRTIVPEPTSFIGLVVGAGSGYLMLRRRRSAVK